MECVSSRPFVDIQSPADVTAIQLENPSGHVIQEVAVMCNSLRYGVSMRSHEPASVEVYHDGALVLGQVAFQPRYGLSIQVICGLIKQQ